MSRKKATPPMTAAPDLPDERRTWMLRTCSGDMTSYNGFRWPESGFVAAPDWRPTDDCGHGLHGLLMGVGDGSLLDWKETAKWLVVEIDRDAAIDLHGKVKAPWGVVVFCGARDGAVAFLASKGADPAQLPGGQASASGDSGQASASGYSGQASASGDSGQASASGPRGQASASGYSGQASASGYSGQASASGDSGLAIASGRVAAGPSGAVVFRYWSGPENRFRYKVGYVGEEIEPYFWYDLDKVGAWRKGEPVADDLLPPAALEARKAAQAQS